MNDMNAFSQNQQFASMHENREALVINGTVMNPPSDVAALFVSLRML